MKDKILKLITFFTKDIWTINTTEYSKAKSFGISISRIVILTIKSLNADKIVLRASALTYYTMMAVIPVFALGFAIAKSLNYDEYLQNTLLTKFAGQEHFISTLLSIANGIIAKTSTGVITGVGVIVLLWAIIKVFNNLELSFNDIWHLNKQRPYIRRMTNYLALLVIAPVALILFISVNIFLQSSMKTLSAEYGVFQYVSPILVWLFKAIPLLLMIGLLVFIYMSMPYTKVRFKAALVAGILAGIGIEVIQWFYIDLQMGISRLNAIYGSFAAIPLLLVWLQLSWLIVLIGAKISFAHQNVAWYEFEDDIQKMNLQSHKIIALHLVIRIIKNFQAGNKPLSEIEITSNSKVPKRVLTETLYYLIDCGLIVETPSKEDEEIKEFLPAYNVDTYTLSYVNQILENHGSNAILEHSVTEMETAQLEYQQLAQYLNNAAIQVKLKDL